MLSACGTTVDGRNREQLRHGTTAFPLACYDDDLVREAVPWHWHDELEAAVVAEGVVRVVIGGEQFDAAAGEGFFVNAGALHSCNAVTADRCRVHSLVFHPRLVGGGAESVFHQKYVSPVVENRGFEGMRLTRDADWQGEMLDAVAAAWRACAGEAPRFELTARHRLSEALAALCAHMTALPGERSPKALRDGERIKAMLRFVMDNYGEPIDTAAIARSAAVSESECLRCFKAAIGSTPIRFLREYRVERAAAQLKAGGAAIADIAARCGFQDVSYFTRTFRELMGVTPRAYREGR